MDKRTNKENSRGAQRRKLIVGIGNRCMGDDGIGSYIAEVLQSMPLRNVKVIDGGLGNLELIYELQGFDEVLFIDVITSKYGKPCEVKMFSLAFSNISSEELMKLLTIHNRHRITPVHIVALARSLNIFDGNAYLLGIIPYMIRLSTCPSENILYSSLDKVIFFLEKFLDIELNMKGYELANKIMKICQNNR